MAVFAASFYVRKPVSEDKKEKKSAGEFDLFLTYTSLSFMVYHEGRAYEANSYEEAVGKAHLDIYKKYPPKEGFEEHSIHVVEYVPSEQQKNDT